MKAKVARDAAPKTAPIATSAKAPGERCAEGTTELIAIANAPPIAGAVQTVVKGDSLSFSIAAASVIAKVTRDRIMRGLALRYPGYGWETNVGYATPEHGDAIRRLGITHHHRLSFAPVRLVAEGELPLLAALEAVSL